MAKADLWMHGFLLLAPSSCLARVEETLGEVPIGHGTCYTLLLILGLILWAHHHPDIWLDTPLSVWKS